MPSHTLQRKYHLFIPFLGIARPQSQFHIHVSVGDLYISTIVPHMSCSRIGRSIMGKYKSLTDTWMWKLGLWLRSSFPGNICFEFSVLVLCSAWLKYWPYKVLINCWDILAHSPTLNAAKARPKAKTFCNPYSISWMRWAVKKPLSRHV